MRYFPFSAVLLALIFVSGCRRLGLPMRGHAVAYSPDGREIVSAVTDHSLRRWAGRCVNNPLDLGTEKPAARVPALGIDQTLPAASPFQVVLGGHSTSSPIPVT